MLATPIAEITWRAGSVYRLLTVFEYHASGANAVDHDLLHVGAQAQLAARGCDHRQHGLRKARWPAHRIKRPSVVGSGDQGMLQQRCRFRWSPIVTPARAKHGAQARILDGCQRLGQRTL